MAQRRLQLILNWRPQCSGSELNNKRYNPKHHGYHGNHFLFIYNLNTIMEVTTFSAISLYWMQWFSLNLACVRGYSSVTKILYKKFKMYMFGYQGNQFVWLFVIINNFVRKYWVVTKKLDRSTFIFSQQFISTITW